MRIVCDSCGAKYSIADEKIAGKLFKVRCKKCSNMIMVDGTNLGGAEDNVPVPGAAAGPAAWYVVIDGAQSGPFSQEEVTAQINAGTVDGETFAWQEGMTDWEKLGQLPSFRSAIAVSPVSPISQIAEVASFDDESTRVVGAGESAAAGGAFVSAAGAPGAEPGPSSAQPSGTGLLSHGGGGASASNFFAAGGGSQPSSSGASNAPSGGGMTDARNESSVLFSLSDLTAKKKSLKEDLPTTEASGLIDIRVLASGAGKAEESTSDDSAPAAGAMAMAPVMALPARRSNTPLILLALFGALIIIALVGALYMLAFREEPAPVVAEAPAPAADEGAGAVAPPTEGSGAEVAAAEGSGAADGSGAAGAADAEVAAAEDSTQQGATGGAAAQQVAAAQPDDEPADEPEEEEEEPEERVASRSTRERSSDDDREPPSGETEDRSPDAVNRALEALRRGQESEESGSTTTTRREEPEEEAEPEGLERDQILSTIRRYGSRIRRCGGEGETGTFRVSWHIQPSGRVTNVRAEEPSDTSQCIVGVVGDMEFPSFRGNTVGPITYPFRL